MSVQRAQRSAGGEDLRWNVGCLRLNDELQRGNRGQITRGSGGPGECEASAISPSQNQQVNFHQQLHSIYFIRIPSLNQSVWIPLAKSCCTNVLETFNLVSNKTWHNFETVQSTQ